MIDCVGYKSEIVDFVVLIQNIHSGIWIDQLCFCFVNHIWKYLFLFFCGITSSVIFHLQIEFLFFLPLSDWRQKWKYLCQSSACHISSMFPLCHFVNEPVLRQAEDILKN